MVVSTMRELARVKGLVDFECESIETKIAHAP